MKRRDVFKIRKARNGEWYTEIVAPNGETIYVSETVKKRSDAVKTVKMLLYRILRTGARIVVEERRGEKAKLWSIS